VDSPAANPGGLFHRDDEIQQSGKSLIDFVLGRSKELPKLSSALGVEIAPERLKSFIEKHLADAGLSIVEKDSQMADKKKPDDEDEKKPPVEEQTDANPPTDDKKKKEEGCSSNQMGDLKKFCETFGNADGAKYFLEGISFEAAQSAHIVQLRAELKDKNDKLASFAKLGLETPLTSSVAEDPGRAKTNEQAEGDKSKAVKKSARERFAEASKKASELASKK
jgi:hypothetical protein